MKSVPNTTRVRAATALLVALFATAAFAQYPGRPIRLLVPNPPGGATDTIARVVAPRLGEALGQPVVVENRPGSNGNLSSELAARAAPDGYTLLLGQDSQIVISPHLYANLQEFLEYARRARPPLAYASIGNGSQHHLTMEMLKARAGIELVHVPYKGGGPATIAVLAGEVPVMFGGNSVTGHIRAGKLRGLAVAGKTRSTTFPELPTLSEFFPGLEVTAWIGIFTASGVPAPVISRLHAEINRLLSSADMREKVRSVGGLEPFISTPAEFAALIRAEHAKYGEAVKAVGVKID